MTTTAAGPLREWEHCARCGQLMAPVDSAEAPAVTSAFRFDADTVLASWRQSLPLGVYLADTLAAKAPTMIDAVIMVGSVYLNFCDEAGVNPVQFMEMLSALIGEEIDRVVPREDAPAKTPA